MKVQQQAQQQQQRKLIILAGAKSWSKVLLAASAEFIQEDRCFYYCGEQIKEPLELLAVFNSLLISKKNYHDYLGEQCQTLIFDDNSLNIEAFAALSGSLCAGGILFLLWPEQLHNSPLIKNSLFLQRFFQQITNDNNAVVIDQYTDIDQLIQDIPPLNYSQNILAQSLSNKSLADKSLSAKSIPLSCKTSEQFEAVKAIQKVFTGHRNRPLVLTADRGRGKSSALAIACADLIKNSKQPLNIIICAPHQQAVAIFFKQLATSLALINIAKNEVTYRHSDLKNQPLSRISFVPIDILLKEQPAVSLLLIDEAAAIPVYLLESVIVHYHRVVFASTQHGYEGAGRGFALKFQQTLKLTAPDHQTFHINQPIRWCDNDPVEQFVFSSCLLNAELESLNQQHINSTALLLTVHNKKTLLKDEKLLAQLFAVLVTAHYQTSPSDLKLILDNEQVNIVSLSHKDDIVAVALLINEGMREGEDQQQAIAGIKQGQRRLKNQFLPQSLINHCGFEQAFDYQYLRIMRIAVHPQVQQQGIGSYFLSQLYHYAKQQQVDFLGTSFGANSALLNFWLNAEFKLIRIGFTKDQASGEHSAMLIKAVSDKSKLVLKSLNNEFYRSFHYLLDEPYQYLSPNLVALILQNTPQQALTELTLFDQQNISAFANKKRLYHSCVFSLHLWLLQHLTQLEAAEHYDQSLLLLITRLLQKRSISEVCQLFSLTGKKALNQQLVDYVQQYY
ncbi:MAG: GNAT family N-acetyltransferase [Gammaproteobacteria bacterium]|nr:MAG: GNAT family N-acetyltransferase [Gammaproteobacteria bacterium]